MYIPVLVTWRDKLYTYFVLLFHLDIVAVDACATLEDLMIRQNTELEEAMREEVERFYKLWTEQKDKLFESCCATGWYKSKKEGYAMMESNDLAKYDYIRQFDKFELTTCDKPTSYEDLQKSVKSLGEAGFLWNAQVLY